MCVVHKKTLYIIGNLSKIVGCVIQDSGERVFCWVYPGGKGTLEVFSESGSLKL